MYWGSDAFILAFVRALIPSADAQTARDFRAMLATRDPDIQRKLALFLRLIRVFARIRHQKRFDSLSPERARAVLRSFSDSPIPLFRKGFWGIRSLALLAHYGHVNHARAIGFDGPGLGAKNQGFLPPSLPQSRVSARAFRPGHDTYDVLIVGSGAGGGVVADRLIPMAQAGARIALLESGPWLEPDAFTQNELEMTRLYWKDAGVLNRQGNLTCAMGRMVGGSTYVYTGVTFDLPPGVWEAWGIPDWPYEDLSARFAALRRDLNVHVLHPSEVNTNNLLFRQGARQCGFQVKDLEISTSNCQGAGFCNLGCVHDAKLGVGNRQLSRAQAAGIEVLANAHVQEITTDAVRVQVLPSPRGSKSGGLAPGFHELRTQRIVLSAGCFGTNMLLARSHLSRLSPLQGRFVCMHPTLTVNGRHPEGVNGFRGFPKTYYVDQFSDSESHYIETAFYYPGVTGKNIEGWGEEHARRMAEYTHLMGIILLNHDGARARNRIGWKRGHMVFDYEISEATRQSLALAQIRAAQIFFAAGCDEVFLPFAPGGKVARSQGDVLDTVISTTHRGARDTVFASAHPQGGCRMGTDPETSVCDTRGRLHHYPHITVADASLFPSSSKVNPYLTVMALADRVGETLLQDEGLT